MLGADVPLPGVTSLFAGQDEDFTRVMCEPLQHNSRIAAHHARRKIRVRAVQVNWPAPRGYRPA
jgi:hypothetical protein